jgi:hypothetical protein
LKQCQKNYSNYSKFHGQHPEKIFYKKNYTVGLIKCKIKAAYNVENAAYNGRIYIALNATVSLKRGKAF